jgi:hypothetical protein
LRSFAANISHESPRVKGVRRAARRAENALPSRPKFDKNGASSKISRSGGGQVETATFLKRRPTPDTRPLGVWLGASFFGALQPSTWVCWLHAFFLSVATDRQLP